MKVYIEPSMPELIRLLQSGGLYHFEIISLPGTSTADLDWMRFREYCQTRRKLEFEESGRPPASGKLAVPGSLRANDRGRRTVLCVESRKTASPERHPVVSLH